MDDEYWESHPPTRSSVRTLVSYLERRDNVESVSELDKHHIVVIRRGKAPVRVYMIDKYEVGKAEIIDILSRNASLDAVVLMGQYNGYSSAAKHHCRHQGIGLFTFKEFLGAVHFDGSKFLDYEPRERA